MSLKRNILANYASQIYVTLIGIVMVPMYVSYMGAEAYGLVGFFTMLQAWFQLLDMGLTPTMARETARFNGGANDALSLRRLLRAMEGIFIGIAVLGGTAMMVGSNAIASSWLKVQQLPLTEVQHSIMIMAVIIGLRWVCGLYRGAINGFERQVWLSVFNIVIATARFVLVIPFFIFVGTTPTQFFFYQLVLAVIETTVLIIQTYRLLPNITVVTLKPWEWAPLRGVLKFSLSIAFTSAVWVLVTQTDKLVLSKLLLLSDYAYFTLATLVAGGVGVLSGPISAALLPRMSKLSAEANDVEMIGLYRNATQLVGTITIPVVLVLAFFGEKILWVWTGDHDIATKAAPILILYTLGNGVLAFGSFQYYLQYAKGDLRLHLIGSLLFLTLLIPLLIWFTYQFGAIGAGWAWLIANSLYLTLWAPVVHNRLAHGLHWQWLVKDVLILCPLPILVSIIIFNLVEIPKYRLGGAGVIIIIGVIIQLSATISNGYIRKLTIKWLSNFISSK